MERLRVKSRVAAADFAALISDGSTDTSVVEQELVYVRTCKAGVTSVDFLGIVPTPKADAPGIVGSITHAVDKGLNLSMRDFSQKLVAFGADGASVMMGKHNGVIARIRREMAPSLVGVHCCAHRLELAVKDVVKKHPLYSTFDRLLLDLYLFYSARYSTINHFMILRLKHTAKLKLELFLKSKLKFYYIIYHGHSPRTVEMLQTFEELIVYSKSQC